PEDKPSHIPPPTTLGEAKKSPWWPQYRKAAEEEIKGLEDNGTWSLVPISSVPRGKSILRGKFVFDDKLRRVHHHHHDSDPSYSRENFVTDFGEGLVSGRGL